MEAAAAAAVVWVDVDLVGERVGIVGGDGRDVVLVGVGDGDAFEDGGLEGGFHCVADFVSFFERKTKLLAIVVVNW